MKTLLVYHYHFRPGGVRSVIECGLQEWCAQRDWRRIVLLTGEAPPSDWLGRLAQNLPRVTLEVQADERLGYLSELAVEPGLPAQITSILGQYLAAVRPDLVWAHNLSLGRNVHLGLALESHCSVREVPLLCHDHDWWPQHRSTDGETAGATSSTILPLPTPRAVWEPAGTPNWSACAPPPLRWAGRSLYDRERIERPWRRIGSTKPTTSPAAWA